jgi:hypothetical protein
MNQKGFLQQRYEKLQNLPWVGLGVVCQYQGLAAVFDMSIFDAFMHSFT